jgi:uncharacterized protein (DUF885 family)
MRFETIADFELYLERLQSFPLQMLQFIESFREGIRLNFVVSLPMIKDTLTELKNFIDGDLKEVYDPLQEPFKNNRFDTLKIDQFEKAIQGVRESFVTFRNFFESEYVQHVRNCAGCDTLPNGNEIYNSCLRLFFIYFL